MVLLIDIKNDKENGRRIFLPLPLFLIGPLFVFIYISLGLTHPVMKRDKKSESVWLFFFNIMELLRNLRGLEMLILSDGVKVGLKFI